MTEKIKSLMLDLCGDSKHIWWRIHLQNVVKRAKELGANEDADLEVLEVAAWLHDIKKVKGEKLDHHITGSEEAGRILGGLGYKEDFIKKVQHCILTHSSDERYPPVSKEAKILADADGLAHFDDFMAFAHYAYSIKKDGIDEGRDRLKERYARVWNKLSPRAKELAKEKYDAIKNVLE